MNAYWVSGTTAVWPHPISQVVCPKAGWNFQPFLPRPHSASQLSSEAGTLHNLGKLWVGLPCVLILWCFRRRHSLQLPNIPGSAQRQAHCLKIARLSFLERKKLRSLVAKMALLPCLETMAPKALVSRGSRVSEPPVRSSLRVCASVCPSGQSSHTRDFHSIPPERTSWAARVELFLSFVLFLQHILHLSLL